VTGGWRKLYNKEIHDLCSWEGHTARMGDMINAYIILIGKPEGKRLSEDLGVDGRVILK
jgi:hypothetical protein